VTAVRQLRSSRPVKLDPTALHAALAELPDAKLGTKGFPWTPELDQILLEYWPTKRQSDVCRLLGCTANTARVRFRDLTRGH
jgi:hypothetical protein